MLEKHPLLRAREDSGISRRELEDASGISVSTIRAVETEWHRPTVTTADRIAEGLTELAGRQAKPFTVEELFPAKAEETAA